MTDGYIAVDWGTTNRRAWRIDDAGKVVDTVRDDRGVLALSAGDFPHEAAALRARLGALPMVAAGMVGSTRGWREVPYVDAPADLTALARGAVAVADPAAGGPVTILPGVALRQDGRCDVMRGEEVQVLGAVAGGLAPGDALFCQPGTHNKWIALEGDRIADFATTMTGELFALVKAHGILAGMLDAPVVYGDAFLTGLERGAGATDLATALFGVRAAVLLGALAPGDAASMASGILIGADVGARSDVADREVRLLASGPLADLYAAAIRHRRGRVVALDSHAAFLAGIHAVREML